MRKIIWIVSLLAALVSPTFAAVSFHAVNSGCGNPNGGNITCNLPTVSTNDYVLCGVIQSILPTTNTTSWNTPSGWTKVYGGPVLSVFGQVWTSGSSVTISPSSGSAGSWEAGICVSYTGVNTSTPIDGAANGASWNLNATAGSLTSTANCIAPSVSPAWTTDMLVGFFASGGAGGSTITLPGALTSRGSTAPGPSVATGDKLLASGAATGLLNGTYSGGTSNRNCVQIPLLPASGGSAAVTAVIPTLGAYYFLGNNLGSVDYSNTLFPVNGDLIAVETMGASSSCSITGAGSWTQVFQTADVGLFTHKYSTGDTTTFTQTGCQNNYTTSLYAVRNYNPSGGTLTSPTVDTSGTASNSSGTTLNSPSLTLASTNELLVASWSSGDNSVNNGGTCTVSTLTTDAAGHYGSNIESACDGEQIPSSTSPGGFTGTFSTSGRLGSGAVAYGLVSASTVRHRSSSY